MNSKKLIIFLLFLVGIIGIAFFSSRRPSSPQSEQSNPTSFLPIFRPSPSPSPTLPPLPKQKILPGGTHVFQTFNNCGPAAFSMLLSHFGITRTQQVLGQQLRPYQNARGDNDDKSVTLAEIAAKAPEFGLVAYRRPAGDAAVIKQLIAHDIPVLARTWLHEGEDIGHFRVIKGFDDQTGQFIQDDSLQGANLRYSYQDFDKLWQAFNYEFLVLVPAEKTELVEQILGELLDEKAAWEKALELANEQITANFNDLYAHFNRSVALYELGRYQEATQEFERIESRLPSRMLWYQIEPILAYLKLGQDQQVLDISSTILNNYNRAFSELYYLRGLIYQKQDNTAAAQENFANADRYNVTGSWKANLPSEFLQ